MTCGIVLAGGASSRMGQPKALLPLGSKSMLERLAKLFNQFCEQTIIITGTHHSQILNTLPQLAPQLLFNENHADGMFSSLRKGLAATSAETILLSPVDFASIEQPSIASLFTAPTQTIVKPRFEGHSGHPILIRQPAIDALRQADPGSNAKQVLSQFPATYIDVSDPGVAQDCDTPQDYERLLARWKARA
ncbi:MAG: nucleotidyltransferase family protein [Acidobacteria bacterium]|nr:nucleotidyltransferase family protein [Acidobacteriota bacterium]